MIKGLFTAVFTALMLLLIAAVALPYLVPPEKVATLVRDAARKATGREIAFKSARVTIFPEIGVQVTDLSIGNPAWSREREMLRVSKIDIGVALKPLLRRDVQVTRLILDAPVVRLEKAADGRANWDFSTSSGAAPDTASSRANGTPVLPPLADLRVSDASLSYIDRTSGTRVELSQVNLATSFAGLTKPFAIKGDAVYNARPVSFDARVDNPAALLDGGLSDMTATLKTNEARAQVSGRVSVQGALSGGRIAAEVSSVPALIAWINGGAAGASPVKAVALKGDVSVTAQAVALSNATLSLDDVTGKGEVTLSRAARPAVKARLTLDKPLDIETLAGGAAAGGGTTSSKSAKSEEFDVSALKDFDADIILTTAGLRLKGAEIGPGTLTATLIAGKLQAALSETTVFGGRAAADVTLQAAAAPPRAALRLQVKGVQAKPLLSTFAGFSRVSGTVEAETSVTATGRTSSQMLASLSGDGKVVFRNGAFEGIDLVNIAQLLQRKLAQMDIGAGKTEFVEMGGTFTIQNGVASNKDFRMKGPLVQASGAGTVDLPRQYVRYRVTPVLTASSAVDGATGVSIPVDISGPFSDIAVRPDYASVLRDAVTNPDKIENVVKAVRDIGKDIGGQAQPILKEIRKDPAAAIENLLGGILSGQ